MPPVVLAAAVPQGPDQVDPLVQHLRARPDFRHLGRIRQFGAERADADRENGAAAGQLIHRGHLARRPSTGAATAVA